MTSSEHSLDAKLSAIAEYFELGHVQTYTRTSGTNQNYLVTADCGDFLFKIIINTTLEDVLNGMPFLQRLEEHDFPATTYYLRAANGQQFYHSRDCDAVVLRRLAGSMPDPSVTVNREIGLALARLHLVPCDNLPEKRHWLDARYLREGIEAAVKLHGTERLRETLQVFHSLEHFQPATFPQSIIHGDLDSSNCLFEGEQLVAFVDWQEVGVSAALMDFVQTVIGFCFVENWDDENYLGTTFYPEYYAALYEGYTSVRPFSGYEKAHLNDAFRYVGLTQPVWSMLMWEQYHAGEEMVETKLLYWLYGLDRITLAVS